MNKNPSAVEDDGDDGDDGDDDSFSSLSLPIHCIHLQADHMLRPPW